MECANCGNWMREHEGGYECGWCGEFVAWDAVDQWCPDCGEYITPYSVEQAERDISGQPPEETENKKQSPTLARLIEEVRQEKEEGGEVALRNPTTGCTTGITGVWDRGILSRDRSRPSPSRRRPMVETEECWKCGNQYEPVPWFTGAFRPTCLCRYDGQDCDAEGCTGVLEVRWGGDPSDQYQYVSCSNMGCVNWSDE